MTNYLGFVSEGGVTIGFSRDKSSVHLGNPSIIPLSGADKQVDGSILKANRLYMLLFGVAHQVKTGALLTPSDALRSQPLIMSSSPILVYGDTNVQIGLTVLPIKQVDLGALQTEPLARIVFFA
jgi:hypothetical protein